MYDGTNIVHDVFHGAKNCTLHNGRRPWLGQYPSRPWEKLYVLIRDDVTKQRREEDFKG